MKKTMLLLSATAISVGMTAPAAANALDDTLGTDYDYDTFADGFSQTNYYDALDTNDDTYLDRGEYATGLYTDYDRDNDNLVSQDEWDVGTDRYLGAAGDTDFSLYDSDGDSVLNQQEFGSFYGDTHTDDFDALDLSNDGLLSEVEYTTGIYDKADLDGNKVISIEEEAWFEGWFDGDDIDAEIRDAGKIY